jgi:hypothetical protein
VQATGAGFVRQPQRYVKHHKGRHYDTLEHNTVQLGFFLFQVFLEFFHLCEKFVIQSELDFTVDYNLVYDQENHSLK